MKERAANGELSSDRANPYRSPVGICEEPGLPIRKGTRWRLIPTLLFSVFGGIAFAGGLALVYLAISIWRDPELRSLMFYDTRRLVSITAVPLLILFCGTSWLIAARASWLRHWWIAAVDGIVGGAAAAIAFNIPVPQ